ncbi:MAG: carbohydrate ABC transporter permease [Oscillospiraceae bacterium]|nr:carbohydrate ABC transporter permease [Oscillospiraceae bacterium]
MKKQRRINSNSVFTAVIYTVAIVMALLWLYPLIFVVSASFSDPQALLDGKVVLFPVGFNLDAYKYIFANPDIMTGYRNTVFYSVVGTLYNMVLTVFAAYPLSKKDLRGRNFLTVMMTFTMFFGGGMIPTFLNLRDLGMLNTPWVMFIPSAISVTNFIIMRNYFTNSVPGELIEAAHMEGASELQILRKIVLPLSKPILGVLTIYYMSGHWNAYFSAVIYLSDDNLKPLQVFLRRVLIQGGMDGMSSGSTMTDSLIYETLKYGIIVVSTLPMLIGYLLVQKSFKKGIMMGSLKG